MTKEIVLPIKCSTVKKIASASVVLLNILMWVGVSILVRLFIGNLNSLPHGQFNFGEFVIVAFFFSITLSYTWCIVLPKFPKFVCIKDEVES